MNELNIKVTNNLTGEISEVKVTDVEQAKELLLQFKASAYAIAKAQDQIKAYLDEFLGQDEQYQFSDGKILRRVQREMRTWRVETLRKVGLDEDQIDVISKVNMTSAKAMVGELIERGIIAPNCGKTLNEEADVLVQKPFVEVR